jgi:hypothetical protein
LWGNDGTRKFAMAFGTPFGGWSPYRAIELPGEKLLVQLEQQICLVDVAGRRIARVGTGYGLLAFQADEIRETPDYSFGPAMTSPAICFCCSRTSKVP